MSFLIQSEISWDYLRKFGRVKIKRLVKAAEEAALSGGRRAYAGTFFLGALESIVGEPYTSNPGAIASEATMWQMKARPHQVHVWLEEFGVADLPTVAHWYSVKCRCPDEWRNLAGDQ